MADQKPETPKSAAPAAPQEEKKMSVQQLLDAAEKKEKDAAAAAAKTEGPAKKKVRKQKRTVLKARACIHAGDNNTIVTITDLDGKVLGWASSGSSGFKGSRKSTPYSAKVAAEKAMGIVQQFGIQSLQIEVKGIGPGREQAIRGLQVAGVNFDAIVDRTPIAHGGCRAPKPRRV
jgi:small subunit ribosomal protein S11